MKQKTTFYVAGTSRLTELKLTAKQVIDLSMPVKCPYCDTRNTAWLKPNSHPQIILCDQMDGNGCDRYFVVSISSLVANLDVREIEDDDA